MLIDYKNGVECEFWLGKEKYAIKHLSHIPRVGDEMRFNGTVYKLTLCIWIFDDKRPRLGFDMDVLMKTNKDK